MTFKPFEPTCDTMISLSRNISQTQFCLCGRLMTKGGFGSVEYCWNNNLTVVLNPPSWPLIALCFSSFFTQWITAAGPTSVLPQTWWCFWWATGCVTSVTSLHQSLLAILLMVCQCSPVKDNISRALASFQHTWPWLHDPIWTRGNVIIKLIVILHVMMFPCHGPSQLCRDAAC